MTRAIRRFWIAAAFVIPTLALVGVVLFARSCESSARSRQGQVAVSFGNLLVSKRYEQAHGLLSKELASTMDVAALRERYEALIPDDAGRPIGAVVVIALDEWPDKRPGDIGWVHARIAGEGFSKGLTVTVAEEDGKAVIRALEWGRP